jgi:hypothetical protein
MDIGIPLKGHNTDSFPLIAVARRKIGQYRFYYYTMGIKIIKKIAGSKQIAAITAPFPYREKIGFYYLTKMATFPLRVIVLKERMFG